MEKQKRWQFTLILVVLLLTLYNILPTVFFYSKSLDKPIDQKTAQSITLEITKRVNELEKEAVSWINSYCKLIQIKPKNIFFDTSVPDTVKLTFSSPSDAKIFHDKIKRSGQLIQFVPSQLTAYTDVKDPSVVLVKRNIPIHFDENKTDEIFQFSVKFDDKGAPTPLYKALVKDRVLQIAMLLEENAPGSILEASLSKAAILTTAQKIIDFSKAFNESPKTIERYFNHCLSYEKTGNEQPQELLKKLYANFEEIRELIKKEKVDLEQEQLKLKEKSQFLSIEKKQKLSLCESQEKTIDEALKIIKKQYRNNQKYSSLPSYKELSIAFEESYNKISRESSLQSFILKDVHPLISHIQIDWNQKTISLVPYEDIVQLQEKSHLSFKKEQISQLLYNEIADLSRSCGEAFYPNQNMFCLNMDKTPNSNSFLAMKLSFIAKQEASRLNSFIKNNWHPSHPDLKEDSFPILDLDSYQALEDKKPQTALLVYAPSLYSKVPEKGFRMHSIYVVAKGFNKILKSLEINGETESSKQFLKDFNNLYELLRTSRFFGYKAADFIFPSDYQDDYIFESEDYFQTVLKATREDFQVYGTKRYAILDFSDLEQRILTQNKIDNSIHEDLLKWRDDYRADQIRAHQSKVFEIPKPSKNAFISNLKLSMKKYFRGDEKKTLHWGLDLSGGKTVQIALKDHNNKIITNPDDIKQGMNELYARVNKMGVSEVSIRQEGNSITLDFPGSQNLSAAELVKASSMSFHVVNEKFSIQNHELSEAVNRFLQGVWNEAVITNKKAPEDIHLIAWKHIHGDNLSETLLQPRNEWAQILYEQGLKLAHPFENFVSSAFNDNISKITIMKGNDLSDWQGQSHPLMIVFQNYALEGANLENVKGSYTPSQGNFLEFRVKNSYTNKAGKKITPQEDLAAWTSHFSKEKITGTQNSVYSNGRGWRMAVILNGYVISSPALESTISHAASITGNFSQREINQLEADIKAGSLTFSPQILSEKNVSPELGKQEKNLGITATFVALVLVIATMCFYYRFGGLVASVAVIFNILILWATLQNLNANISLAGIAGIILTVGMAVDANVLVFERIREEFKETGRIASAVQAGYKKAFSAIVDSNITTIIAAVVLLQFDSGPVKGFALTLIIGIVSSMFTALFMTKYFFSWWIQNPKNKKLEMLQLINASDFNFLKYTKLSIISSLIVIVTGLGLLISQRHTIFGMDFTGGYAINLSLEGTFPESSRKIMENILIKKGADQQDFQIRELNNSNQLRIFLSKSLKEKGKPFYNMPLETEETTNYRYEKNPRILWIVDAVNEAGFKLSDQQLESLDSEWTEVSGQLSESMKTNALLGLSIALLCILVYVAFRFEVAYAISATLCILHDVIFTVAAIGILHAIGVAVQIDLNTIAALLTIVGYSLNDTIIVFDRIREDLRFAKKTSLKDVINKALNVTLSRTTLTSGTTLLVLLPLVFLGGSTIFGFSLVMTIGVVFGTLSSLFVAAPLMSYFYKKENH